MTRFSEHHAARFAAIALSHVEREWPHKLDQVLNGEQDLQRPRDLHPVFFGSFDWHSCVHGYWLLARTLRRHPGHSLASTVRAHFDRLLTPANLEAERAYLDRPMSAGFERPYGWGWALALGAELERLEGGEEWAAAYAPLARAFSARFLAYLPKATYPVRAGVHSNTAFALLLALDYARGAGDDALLALVCDKALSWYGADENAQAWEPDQDAFLSPTLIEAALMAEVLPARAFQDWFARFLPAIGEGRPATLLTPAHVSDRTDGKIAHLDGLNLSRAFCLFEITKVLDEGAPTRAVLLAAAEGHLASALGEVEGDFMGEHWLASFAALALEAAP
jgi:hypothetical protein